MDNLAICLQRQGLHAPNSTPTDGLVWKTNHDAGVQARRHVRGIPCGPRGVLHDYVPFYFGYLSPMLLQLKTGQVEGYNEGQEPLIYLVSTAQTIRDSGTGFVFSDGHGIAGWTKWFDDLADLDKVDWDVVYQRYWADSAKDLDRQRRKQAEFLVHGICGWSLMHQVAVVNQPMKARVEAELAKFPAGLHRPVEVRPGWYY